MKRHRQPAWPLTAILVLAFGYALHAGGYLGRIENAVSEKRALLLAHETNSDIVIVGIDSHSLRELSEWPWPRRHYARLLQHLERAAPKRLFIDIDFSSRSNEDDDGLLENALAAWTHSPVLLATHFQLADGKPDPGSLTRPLERFARHAGEVAVTLEQSRDGLVRAMQSSWQHRGRTIPSVFRDEAASLTDGALAPIDFSILPSSFYEVSFSDLLNGEIDLEALSGKTVYVGATAVELGDAVPVPVYRTLPGVVVQALATETVREGPLRQPTSWAYLAALAAWTAAVAMLFAGRSWRKNAALVGAAFAVLGCTSVYLYAVHRVDVPIVPFGVVIVAVFGVTTLRSLDFESWRAWVYALRLKRRDALLRSIVESSTDGIVCVDGAGAIRTANAAACRLLAAPTEELIGADIGGFLPPLAEPGAFEALAGEVTEYEAVKSDGGKLPVEVSISRVAVDDDLLYTAIIRDVSERVAQQRQLEYQATHDRLTGLPNRTALYAYLESMLGAVSGSRRAALLMLDLTRFTEVNDTLGHDVGDDVLTEAAGRFTAALGRQGFIARVGGDEFAVVLSAVERRDDVDGVALALVDSLKAAVHARGIAIEVAANIGIALVPDHARDGTELLRRADVAMYAAKRRGSWFEYYDQSHDGHTVRRLAMISELRSALASDEISLHYQPQVDLRTGRVGAVEALLRWEHPMLGRVPPDEFIGLAESTNLIRPLTDWTIRRALTDAGSWRARGTDIRVAVNISARMLQDAELAQHVAQLLAAHSVDASRLELEITESAMMLDPDRALQVVQDLGKLGLSISIDDYGTGFSSLGYLRDLHANALKLDKSFVMDIEEREHNRVIVESTAQMAHALGLEIVAEGIETAAVENYLTRAGYDLGQGYWFARPMPANDCLAWINRFNTATRRQAG